MDYTKIPSALINKYLWDLAKGDVSGTTKVPNDIFGADVSTYTYSPFFPVSENTGAYVEKPFITYQSMPRLFAGPSSSDYWHRHERLLYTVVAPMPSVMYISNFIYNALGQADATASAINSHVADNIIIFDMLSVYGIDTIDETTKYNSIEPRYTSEIIVDFDYRRTDL